MKKIFWAGGAGALALAVSLVFLIGAAAPPCVSATLSAASSMNQSVFNTNSASASAAQTALNASLTDLENAGLQLSVTPQGSGFTTATVSGALEVGDASFPIAFDEGNFAQMTTPQGAMEFAPVNGTMRLPNGQHADVILGTEFIPGTTNIEASLTISDIGVPVHLFFGKPFVETSWNQGMAAAEKQLQTHLSAAKIVSP